MNVQAHFSLRQSSLSAAPEPGAATGSWRGLGGRRYRVDAVEMPCPVFAADVVVLAPALSFACLHKTYMSLDGI